MLNNALSLLVFWTRKRVTEHPDAPVFYFHLNGNEKWQVIVQKIPEQEVQAA